MSNRWRHFKTVCKHKSEVFKECKACGITWQGIVHDLSKFSWIEFSPSAQFFQGTGSPIEREKAKVGYSIAWLNHKGRNRHHWEWWTDFADDGTIIANRIPKKYVIEMICDWIAAGKTYSKEQWTRAEPLNYYNKVRAGRHFHPETELMIVLLLEVIRDYGLKEYHRFARLWLKSSSYVIPYVRCV